MLQTAKIVEWDSERSFGYLDHAGQRLFLHVRDYSERHHFPRKGDKVSFYVGEDAKGRPCAVKVRSLTSRSRLQIRSVFVLLLLLALPTLAVLNQPFNLLIVLGYFVGISVVSWRTYTADKNRAQSGGWRISEATLHFLDFSGGWPGGFLAQRHLRHKTSKGTFQFMFWSIIFAYQFVAFDYLADWQWSRMFLKAIEPLLH